MNLALEAVTTIFFLLPVMVISGCGPGSRDMQGTAEQSPRTVRVALSGEADVTGSDNTALQKAADMLRPGDTLWIGPGTWNMENSVFIPVSDVTVRGVPGETVLRKAPGVATRILDCGDYGESVLVVQEPGKFRPGMGISITDDRYGSGWAVTVSSVEKITGDTLHLTRMTLRDYNYETGNARVESKFPVFCVIEQKNVAIEGITVDGNREENPYFLDGCRGGGIYLYRSTDCVVRNCVVRGYNGDGISYQITDNIRVFDCESYENTNYGIHPGTGSPNSEIAGCRFHDNDRIGFFLCWRVRYGHFHDNLIENNGLYGISIGHKDTDNLFENNTIRNNGFCGVLFREETFHLSGHRNVFRDNTIADNGDSERGYGVYVEPHAGEITLEGNVIAETRSGDQRTQRYGVYVLENAGPVHMKDNRIEGMLTADFFDENQ